MWENNQRSIIYATGVPKGKEKDYGAKKTLEEIMPKKFPNLTKDINPQIQKAPWTHWSLKKSTPGHPNQTDENKKQFEASQRKTVVLGNWFEKLWISHKKPWGQEKWHSIFKVLKEKNYQPRILYSPKMFFRY